MIIRRRQDPVAILDWPGDVYVAPAKVEKTLLKEDKGDLPW